jgi:hypothetical protein
MLVERFVIPVAREVSKTAVPEGRLAPRLSETGAYPKSPPTKSPNAATPAPIECRIFILI